MTSNGLKFLYFYPHEAQTVLAPLSPCDDVVWNSGILGLRADRAQRNLNESLPFRGLRYALGEPSPFGEP
jgi:hypothetical protein